MFYNILTTEERCPYEVFMKPVATSAAVRRPLRGAGAAVTVNAAPTAPPGAGGAASDGGVAWPRPAYAWYVVLILTTASSFALLDRVAIGLMVDPIKRDLHMSDTQMGVLQGLAFAIFYSLCGLPVGMLVDRWRRVRLLSAGIVVWSAATMACGLAQSYASLFLARITVGAGESVGTPSSASLIADYFSPARRAQAIGVFMVAGALGQAMAYLIGGVAIGAAQDLRAWAPALFGGMADWRVSFLLIGAPGLLVASILALTVREPVRRERLSSRPAPLGALWTHMRGNAGAYGTVIFATASNAAVIAAQVSWFPSLFVRVHHWTPTQIGTTFAIVGFPCGVLSALGAGWIMSGLARRGRFDGPILLMIAQAVVWSVFGPLKALAPTPTLALLAHVPTALTAMWSTAATLTALNQITPNEFRGQVIAISAIMTGLVAYSIGSASVGIMNDHLFAGPAGVASSLTCVYLICGMASLAILLPGRAAFARSALRKGLSPC